MLRTYLDFKDQIKNSNFYNPCCWLDDLFIQLESVFFRFGRNELKLGFDAVRDLVHLAQKQVGFLGTLKLCVQDSRTLDSDSDKQDFFIKRRTRATQFFQAFFVDGFLEEAKLPNTLALIGKIFSTELKQQRLYYCDTFEEFQRTCADYTEIESSVFVRELKSLQPPLHSPQDLHKIIAKFRQSRTVPPDFGSGLANICQQAQRALGQDNTQRMLQIFLANEYLQITDFPRFLNIALQFGVGEELTSLMRLLTNYKSAAPVQSDMTEVTSVVRVDDVNFAAAIEHLRELNHAKKYPEKELDVIVNDFLGGSKDVEFPLPRTEVEELKRLYLIVLEHGKKLVSLDDAVLRVRLQECITKTTSASSATTKKVTLDDNQLLLLAIIREQAKRSFGFFPYNVQVLNVLAFLHDPTKRKIAQIKTGEGKSAIIAILAAFHALIGNTVDIATTSRDLAQRDANKMVGFYRSLGLTVGENASSFSNPVSYTQNIVYGTMYDFEHAYLFESLSGAPIRGARPFRVMIADEVDNMFLDTTENEAIISGGTPLFGPYTYRCVWEYMQLPVQPGVQKDMAGLRNHLITVDSRYAHVEEEYFARWFKCASQAQRMSDGKDYVVRKRRAPGGAVVWKVIIVDYMHTGQLKESHEWQDGLHGIIAAKESALRPGQQFFDYGERYTGAAVSHLQFFKPYEYMYGVTGTLGVKEDRDELLQHYGTRTFDSPPYRDSRKVPIPDCVLPDEGAKKAAIKQTVERMVQSGRPVLILCETIAESAIIYAVVKDLGSRTKLYDALQDESAEEILSLSGTPGAITVATNTAGRGADIVPTPEAEKNGGVHVILTFLPMNERVERQGFGRTGRQGRQGTFHYILKLEDFSGKVPEMQVAGSGPGMWDSSSSVVASSAAKFQCDTILQRWRDHRSLQADNRLQNRMHICALHELKFCAQKIYFSFPGHVRNKTQDVWVKSFTKIDRFNREKMFAHSPCTVTEQDVQDAKKFVLQQLLVFWETCKLPETNMLGKTLAEYVQSLPLDNAYDDIRHLAEEYSHANLHTFLPPRLD